MLYILNIFTVWDTFDVNNLFGLDCTPVFKWLVFIILTGLYIHVFILRLATGGIELGTLKQYASGGTVCLNVLPFTGLKISLLCSQEPATGPYHEQYETSRKAVTILKIYFNIIVP
jgi:hypothetical protein